MNIDQLWADKYAPDKEAQLAIRPSKLTEVKFQIQTSALAGSPDNHKLLVLSGPTGCGKSTMIRILGPTLGYDVVDWANQPTETRYSIDYGYESNMTRFEEFLQRSIQSIHSLDDAIEPCSRQKIILLDDIPDILNDTNKFRFQNLLQRSLRIKKRFLLVLVISDAWMYTESKYSSNDQRLTSLRDLVPQQILQSEHCRLVQCNPIVKSQLVKVMDRILDAEFGKAKSQIMSKNQVSEIAELSQGDIRCAINTLQFYSLTVNRVSTVPSKRKKTNDTRQNLLGRGAPLELFHALGKVLYCKRDRHGVPESEPETIMELLPVDHDVFLAYLHENYIKCHQTIEGCAEAMEQFSDADYLSSMGDWREPARLQYQSLVAMRGFMLTRKSPIKGGIEMNKPTYNSKFVQQAILDDRLARTMVQKEELTDPGEWGDEISEDFSEDDFDDIFGDGTDLADLVDDFACPPSS
ncbi:Rad17 cell cycle checkpoint protein-domain-containing protein [Radiomyces spectabilis]|uniref:Rad17 cell cycle checkpoint protein-domain-containing protein n=1 Tax=Radiomyces spectabilis TaxID=64574 RepID=UPI00221F8B51|nr:Rad17 cell cycle checkpoint protein-domain-containing protein [Radiomyces spectabilis]KAI8368195.1 Rad17 cell cycle checkpoint protein-domain-containing protein [Radiomyces spectabilis]